MKIFLGFIIITVIIVSFFALSKKGIKPKSNSWIHLSIEFNNYQDTLMQLTKDATLGKPAGIYKELVSYLKEVVDSSRGLINRYFFLFEPNPPLFLALEVKDMKNVDLIRNKINQIKKPNSIDLIKIDLNTGDEKNGEAAIDFFYSGTKYAFYRASKDYKPGYEHNDETKLVHCFSNQLFVDQRNEINFYLKCLRYRGVIYKQWIK